MLYREFVKDILNLSPNEEFCILTSIHWEIMENITRAQNDKPEYPQYKTFVPQIKWDIS